MSNKNNWRKKQMKKKLQSKHNENQTNDQTNDNANDDRTNDNANDDQTNDNANDDRTNEDQFNEDQTNDNANDDNANDDNANDDRTNDRTNDNANETANEEIITKPKRGRPRIEIRRTDNPEYFNQYFKSHKRKLLDRQHVYKEKKKQHDKDRDTVKLIDDLNNKVKKWISFKNREFYGIVQNENGLYGTRKAVLASQ